MHGEGVGYEGEGVVCMCVDGVVIPKGSASYTVAS